MYSSLGRYRLILPDESDACCFWDEFREASQRVVSPEHHWAAINLQAPIEHPLEFDCAGEVLARCI